jgi:hypothetical protein
MSCPRDYCGCNRTGVPCRRTRTGTASRRRSAGKRPSVPAAASPKGTGYGSPIFTENWRFRRTGHRQGHPCHLGERVHSSDCVEERRVAVRKINVLNVTMRDHGLSPFCSLRRSAFSRSSARDRWQPWSTVAPLPLPPGGAYGEAPPAAAGTRVLPCNPGAALTWGRRDEPAAVTIIPGYESKEKCESAAAEAPGLYGEAVARCFLDSIECAPASECLEQTFTTDRGLQFEVISSRIATPCPAL